MARQLWLLRHAEAEPHGARVDSARRLTERGERQARAAGVALERIGASFEGVLFSPKVRARQTAELAAESWSADQRAKLTEALFLAGGFDAAQALDALAKISADGRLLLIGHEPDLSRLIADLSGGRVDVKKGGLAVVRLEGGGPRLKGVVGELAALVRPRELALIADPTLRIVGPPVGGD
jgi:phosphohistidine phosphatase